MLSSIVSGLQGLTDGVTFLFTIGGLKNVIMIVIGGTLIYLGVKKDVEPLLLGADRIRLPPRQHPAQRSDAYWLGPRRETGVRGDGRHSARSRQGTRQGGYRLPAHDLQYGHRQRVVSAADLHRHRGDDRFRAAAREPENPAVRRRRPVRHLPHAAAGARARLHGAACGQHRGDRRVRRADRDLCRLAIRARTAGADLGRGLFLHGAGADHPAADHEGADDREGTHDGHADGEANRLAERQAHFSRSRSRSSPD